MEPKKMGHSSGVISFVFVVACIGHSASWVFTDIDLKQLALYDEDYDLEFTEEELRNLKFSLIYPGTKWCGSGDIADSYEDLGTAVETDICCRAHDNCPEVIAAGETRHNLTNDAFYSRLSCDCDEEFRQCLRNTTTSTSKHIGTIYFNALGTQCYREDYPVLGCKRYSGWLNRKCTEHEYDTLGQRRYQWFDVPNF